MELIRDYIDPVRLTGMIRQALHEAEANRFRLSQWLPSQSVNDVTYSYTAGQQGLAEASVYRSFDAESRIGRREGIAQVMGQLPPMSEKLPLNEYDQIRLRSLGEAEVLPFIARDAERLARNIAARLELARGQALFGGQVTIAENGLQQTVDYGRSASHTVTAATPWTDYANATPLDDFESWVETYSDTNGQGPSVTLMPRQVFGHLRRCEQVKGQAFPLAGSSAPIPSADQVRGVLDSLDIPPVEIYDAKVSVEGTATRVTPADQLALLPMSGADLGETLHGTTVEATEPEYGLTGDEPGVVAAQWKTKDPVRVWTHAVTIALPVLRAPDATMAATVA